MLRRAILVRGIVQGVGFRPFVYHLALRLGLSGFVQNRADGVRIEVQGPPDLLDRFQAELTARPPPLARIEQIDADPCPLESDTTFRIASSDQVPAGPVRLGADVATCPACTRELFDPRDRRHRYPFLNCTACGPRLTIIRSAPYDRERTTMAGFPMCPACQAEYDDPSDRRFHAQPTACPACGPRLRLLDQDGNPLPGDPLARAEQALREGRIVAVKGLGGFHLACDARRADVVGELRRRKHRDEKPFAVMVLDREAARQRCQVSDAEDAVLCSARRPIVLLRKRHGLDIADAVAPGNPLLGIMLPYTPLHHLLLHDLAPMPLVVTSGNRSDEPIVHLEDQLLGRLGGIADLFLTNDRPIHLRCDDGVTRIVGGRELPLRRSRGHAPQPIALPVDCPRPILAVGGQVAATFALAQGRHALLSHHLGDQDQYEAQRAFVESVAHYERLFAIRPGIVAHDLHPDHASTRYALERLGVIPLPVQHHHAHLASCMADNGLTGPVIGVTFDGTGFGSDGAIWGGEVLVGDYRGFERAAHLRYVPMPGGEQAIREIWRMALAHLLDAGEGTTLLGGVDPGSLRLVEQVVRRRVNAPLTSSAGRLFDAVAALAGVRHRVGYEGQAAMELEWLAEEVIDEAPYPWAVEEPATGPMQLDTRPLIQGVARDVRAACPPKRIARRFHRTLVEMIAWTCTTIRERTGLRRVVLSGGVFQNALLSVELTTRLERSGLEVYRHHQVPCGDGGLCLGQVAVAAAWSGSR